METRIILEAIHGGVVGREEEKSHIVTVALA